jgi:tetratricopeptide (TPR) repeat protein
MRVAAILFLAAALAWTQSYETSPGYAAYRQANSLFVAKKMPEALASLEQALKLDPKLVPALTLYAKIAMSMNRFELARESLERALEADPNAAYARFLYGLNYYLPNDLTHALPEFEKARAANPKDGRARLYLGLTYESIGRVDDAMRMYEESVRVGPSTEGYLAGARLLNLEGHLEECEHWIRNALRYEPQSRDAHFELARLLLREEKLEEAAKEGERALELRGGDVTDSQIHYLLVRAYRVSAPALASKHADALRSSENAK